MPTYFYICASPEAKAAVKSENLRAIDNFIRNPTKFKGPLDNISPLPKNEVTTDNVWINGAYQIASMAVAYEKPDILKHIGEKICFSYRWDGNSYDLFVLSMEENHVNMIDVLWKIACDNGWYKNAKESLELASRRLIGNYSKLTKDEEIIKILPIFCNKPISLEELYCCSIRWNHPKITEWLLQRHFDRIDPKWTRLAIEFINDKGIMTIIQALKNSELVKSHLYKPNTNFVNPNSLETCIHGLILSDFQKGPYQWTGWNCDICSKSFSKGTKRWNCKLCQKDECIDCHK